MSDEYLVRHCAPTLAGLKTASLFTCPYNTKEGITAAVRSMNQRLKSKGLRMVVLRFTDSKALIYLYRPKKLSADLSHSTAATLLRCCGYNPASCERCVVTLAQKLRREAEFPHEIGLFLGYPPEDVCGFMEQGPDCCKCSGCWKVYTDVESAQRTFARYKKCTRVYCDQWAKGRAIEHLTVAG